MSRAGVQDGHSTHRIGGDLSWTGAGVPGRAAFCRTRCSLMSQLLQVTRDLHVFKRFRLDLSLVYLQRGERTTGKMEQSVQVFSSAVL